MNKICPEKFPVAISALAAAIYNQIPPEDVGLVASVLVHLGESIGLIAAARNASGCGTSSESAAIQAGDGGA
ncbi:MAG: hypothetical protein K2K44_04170 [Oscillospiraceae bacterium]|nr:hypothetical protein [Oscillospiraceae bacterium]